MTYKRMLLIAAVFAAIAAFGANKYLQELALQANIKELPYVEVIVAKQDIPINKVVDTNDIQVKKLLKGDEHPSAFNDTKELLGKISTTKIAAGEQILTSKVAKKGDTQMGLGFLVGEGMRAVTVAISEVTGVGYMIKPGDRVDILVRVNKEIPNQEKILGVSTLLQNVKVLAMGKNLSRELANESEAQAKTVTLEVYPVDTEKIFLASQDAMLFLTLRSPGDASMKNVPAVKFDDLSPELLKKAPVQGNTQPPKLPARR